MTDDPKGLVAGSDNSRTTNWQAAEPQVITIRPVAVEQVDIDLANDYLNSAFRCTATLAERFAKARIEATAAKDAETDRLAQFFREERPDLGFEGDGKLIKLGRVLTAEQWVEKKRDDQLAEINRKLDLIVQHLGIGE